MFFLISFLVCFLFIITRFHFKTSKPTCYGRLPGGFGLIDYDPHRRRLPFSVQDFKSSFTMAAATTCFGGLTPMLFRKKMVGFEGTDLFGKNQSSDVPKNAREIKGSMVRSSYGVAGNFVTLTELRKKILSFRDLLDLSPCIASASVTELAIETVKDLRKLHPDIIPPSISMLETDRTTTVQVIIKAFCEALKVVGNFWMKNDEWMVKCKHIDANTTDLEQFSLAMLDDMISMARERLFDMMDEDEDMKGDYSSPTNAFGKAIIEPYSDCKMTPSSPPATPTSVLPEMTNYVTGKDGSKLFYSQSLHFPLRVQDVGKLNPIDVKRLSFHMYPHVVQQMSNPLHQMQMTVEEPKSEMGAKSGVMEDDMMELDMDCDMGAKSGVMEDDMMELDMDCDMAGETEKISMTNFDMLSCDKGRHYLGNFHQTDRLIKVEVLLPPSSLPRLRSIIAAEVAQSTPQTPSSPSTPKLSQQMEEAALPPLTSRVIAPCSPPSMTAGSIEIPRSVAPPLANVSENVKTPEPLLPPTATTSEHIKSTSPPPPPPPPPPMASKNMPPPPPPLPMTSENIPPPPPMSSGNIATLPPPPPPPLMASGKTPPPPPPPLRNGTAPPPPPPMMSSNGSAPPPGMRSGNGAAPPPPPVLGGPRSLGPQKSLTKLKRSSQMGSLYRQLKGKVEGSSLDGKSKQGKKGTKVGAPAAGGKQGMADALAEMTKRSAYFQQIEEDVKNHANSIKEVKVALSSFQTTDMAELIKFHKYVESHMEKLTDETQVLARFEDFPSKKLEGLRMAAALYSKLDAIVTTLQKWKIVAPLNQLLDKVENYFNKIKRDLDTLDRTKDEEAKKFKSQKIHFDFGILIRIKELMVDISSSCMELALKERREAMEKENKECESKADQGKKKGSAKMLWRAFQFAFRVYTFAGGQDDRADMLTRELAQEIETDPQN